ncbi:hypothetical protein ACN6AT_36320 (plasmid) [Streptomyces sp. JL4002]|uniref:hypothetical protein n=1 Tax=Streptomyces sp. JL4002 TaxID=3404781 RepID=UPI003B27E85D
MLKLSTDPLFTDKVRDVVGMSRPAGKVVVLWADEKTRSQALNRSQPVLPVMPGVPERRSRDDIRADITTLFATPEVATGKVISSLDRLHRAARFTRSA